jgi:hypothetical protein
MATTEAQDARGVQIGDHNSQHNYFAGRREIRWPHLVGSLPPLADCHQVRPLDHALLADGDDGQPTGPCHVLIGSGGVGKTQIAVHLSRRLRQSRQVDLLIWVNATSRDRVLGTYAQAAAEITGVEDPSPEQGAVRLLAWLDDTDKTWLVVLDDLTDPDDLSGLWPPDNGRTGKTVITTRRRDASLTAGRHVVDVDLFTVTQSIDYLRAKLGSTRTLAEEPEDLRGLAADLGYLPLAMAQAAAYMIDRKITCAEYRSRFATRQLADLTPMSLPDQHRAIVATTWQLSIAAAEELTDYVGRPLLELAARLDPDGVPTELFGTVEVTRFCCAYATVRTGAMSNSWIARYALNPARVKTINDLYTAHGGVRAVRADETRDALRVLHQLSLVSVDETSGTLRMHALIQRAVRESSRPADGPGIVRIAADGLVAVWPDLERDIGTARMMRSNTAALRRHPGDGLFYPRAHPVLTHAAHSVGQVGLVRAAVAAFEELVEDLSRIFTTRRHLRFRFRPASKHPDLLTVRHNLAYWHGRAGEPDKAIVAYEHLLPDFRRCFGRRHHSTLSLRHNLAGFRGEAGDPAGAAAAYADLADDRRKVLGPEHPDTLLTRAQLAYWQGQAGDPAGAANAYRSLLADDIKVRGADHPMTLKVRANLAHYRGLAGDPEAALRALGPLLRDQLRILGADHGDTLNTRNLIAGLRGTCGDLSGAITLLEQLLADRMRIQDPHHPDILDTRGHLAEWYGRSGDVSQAVAILEQLLEDQTQIRGPWHPDTRDTRDDLTRWRKEAAAMAVVALNFRRLRAAKRRRSE